MNKKIKKTLTLLIFMVIVLSGFSVSTATASAASVYSSGDVAPYGLKERVQIGEKYFQFYDYRDEETGELKRCNLYCASSETSKGTKIFSFDPTGYTEFCHGILSNGSKVYYLVTEYFPKEKKSEYRLYSVSTSGKNRKLIRKLNFKNGMELKGIYDGYLYFSSQFDTEDGGGDGKLYALNLKTEKYKRVAQNFFVTGYDGHSRYLYGHAIAMYGMSDDIIVFDCKTGNYVNVLPNADKPVISEGKLRFMRNGNTMYETNLTGTLEPKCIFTFDGNPSLLTINQCVGDKIYYTYFIDETYYEYVRCEFDVKSGITTELSRDGREILWKN